MHVQDEITKIVSFLQETIGERTPVIGISGGIDSAVTLILLTKAFDVKRIRAFFMPEKGTPESDYRDVESLSKASGVTIPTINIQPMVDAFAQTLQVRTQEALGNIKSRVRMVTLYYQSNISSGIVVGTTNRSEYVVGYYTKFGDGACDIEPIMHLLKRDVREMATALNVPKSIITKKPSAGLWAAQTDESELGISYDRLDQIIVEIFDQKLDRHGPDYDKVRKLFEDSMHKRVSPRSMT